MKVKFNLILALFLFIHLGLLLFLKFTAWPEMLTYPWLIESGYRFYGDIIHPYLPLLPYLLRELYSLLGLSITSLYLITIVFIITSDILVYLISRKMYGAKLGLISLMSIIPLQLFFGGNGLWFDLASLPLILIALYLLINGKSSSKNNVKVVVAGFCIGLATLIKQTNLIFLIPALIILFPKRKFLVELILATFIPLLLTAGIYLIVHQFGEFFYWGFWYPVFKLSRMPGFALTPTVKQGIAVLIIFSPALLLIRKKSSIIVWFIVSLFFAIPRFAYFHLQHAAAFFCLLIPTIIDYSTHKNYKKILFLYATCVLILFLQFAIKDWGRPARFSELDVSEVRKQLDEKIPSGQIVYFYNVPSQYFVGTNILPMKPWVDTFPWYLELPGIQERIISEIEKQHVQLVAYSELNNQGTYELGSYQPKLIDQYIWQNFSRETQINDKIWLLRRHKF